MGEEGREKKRREGTGRDGKGREGKEQGSPKHMGVHRQC